MRKPVTVDEGLYPYCTPRQREVLEAIIAHGSAKMADAALGMSAGGASETLEGPAMTHRMVILQFESMEQARDFYQSPEYTAAREKRKDAASARFVIVEGL